jgi:hypothetical protein
MPTETPRRFHFGLTELICLASWVRCSHDPVLKLKIRGFEATVAGQSQHPHFGHDPHTGGCRKTTPALTQHQLGRRCAIAITTERRRPQWMRSYALALSNVLRLLCKTLSHSSCLPNGTGHKSTMIRAQYRQLRALGSPMQM